MFVQLVSGFGMAFSPTWWLFAIFRCGAGFAHPGIFMTSIILGMELIPPENRSNASILAGVLFSTGQIILGITALLIPNYIYLQLALTIPSFVFVAYFL